MIEILIDLIICGFLGTVLRFYLIKRIESRILDGLLVANIIGITFAFLFKGISPISVIGFSGSLTSFSSFIKNAYNNNNYLYTHLIIYICLSIILINI